MFCSLPSTCPSSTVAYKSLCACLFNRVKTDLKCVLVKVRNFWIQKAVLGLQRVACSEKNPFFVSCSSGVLVGFLSCGVTRQTQLQGMALIDWSPQGRGILLNIDRRPHLFHHTRASHNDDLICNFNPLTSSNGLSVDLARITQPLSTCTNSLTHDWLNLNVRVIFYIFYVYLSMKKYVDLCLRQLLSLWLLRPSWTSLAFIVITITGMTFLSPQSSRSDLKTSSLLLETIMTPFNEQPMPFPAWLRDSCTRRNLIKNLRITTTKWIAQNMTASAASLGR